MPETIMNLPPSFFRRISDSEYEPTEATIGPWSAELQHGGPPSALLTHALRVYPSPGNFRIFRITIEILGTVPVSPCEIRVEKVRVGRRIELLKAHYLSAGKTFMLAHAWRLEAEAGISQAVAEPFVVPPLPDAQAQTFFPGVSYFPYGHALEWRFTQGRFEPMGPATVWTRPRIPLIDGVATNALESMLLMLDSANGISAELDILQWTFVPVDLSFGLYRQPMGEWLGMEARTALGSEGIGQTTTTAFDSSGSVGHSMHTLFVRPR